VIQNCGILNEGGFSCSVSPSVAKRILLQGKGCHSTSMHALYDPNNTAEHDQYSVITM
jgi:hypothetical protein